MNKGQTTIAIIVVLLIFVFWKGKKKAKFGCADLWSSMRNDSAEQIYTETFNLTENDNDILESLTTQAADQQIPLTKMKCLYSVDYMLENKIINLNEKDSINKCICDKILT
jgi:hypothetical protein